MLVYRERKADILLLDAQFLDKFSDPPQLALGISELLSKEEPKGAGILSELLKNKLMVINAVVLTEPINISAERDFVEYSTWDLR
jgi:hypothetical protein